MAEPAPREALPMDAVERVAEALAGAVVGTCAPAVACLDGAIEAHLAKLDEVAQLLDGVRQGKRGANGRGVGWAGKRAMGPLAHLPLAVFERGGGQPLLPDLLTTSLTLTTTPHASSSHRHHHPYHLTPTRPQSRGELTEMVEAGYPTLLHDTQVRPARVCNSESAPPSSSSTLIPPLTGTTVMLIPSRLPRRAPLPPLLSPLLRSCWRCLPRSTPRGRRRLNLLSPQCLPLRRHGGR